MIEILAIYLIFELSPVAVSYCGMNTVVYEGVFDSGDSIEISAYTKSAREGTLDGITSTGTQVRRGVVAGSPDIIDRYGYGSELLLYVEDGQNGMLFLGSFVLEDRMNSRYRKCVDVYMECVDNARLFGRKKAFILQR